MIKVVTSKEMREMDRQTIEDVGIPGVVLMENAGIGTFRVIQKLLDEVENPLVFVFCGKGNNGGDGFVIARHLWDCGVGVRIFIVGKPEDLKGDALVNFNILRKLNISINFLYSGQELEEALEIQPDLIVDALLGTGIQGEVRGFMKEVIQAINAYRCPIVAVDVPSGLNADLPIVEGVAVKADVTVTMALPKRCHVFYPAKAHVGELFIADIGIPHFIRQTDEVKVQMVEKTDIVLPERPRDAHKYNCGKVAVLAGSPGYTGAAALTAEGALRIGAGLVILAVPEELNPIMETKLTEVITRPYPSKNNKTIDRASLPHLQELLEWCDVLAIGPGLGRAPENQEAIIELLKDFSKPAVVDADALFAMANHPDILKQPRPHWIITPHHGEFLRLLPNVTREQLKKELVDLSIDFSTRHKINLLLKGAPSLVSDISGNVFINSTGNPGLASGGTGDVLTGFTAGLMAQGLDPAVAGYTANYLHGMCADKIVEQTTEFTLTATDLIKCLGQVLKEF